MSVAAQRARTHVIRCSIAAHARASLPLRQATAPISGLHCGTSPFLFHPTDTWALLWTLETAADRFGLLVCSCVHAALLLCLTVVERVERWHEWQKHLLFEEVRRTTSDPTDLNVGVSEARDEFECTMPARRNSVASASVSRSASMSRSSSVEVSPWPWFANKATVPRCNEVRWNNKRCIHFPELGDSLVHRAAASKAVIVDANGQQVFFGAALIKLLCAQNREWLVTALLIAGHSKDAPLHTAVRSENIEFIDELLKLLSGVRPLQHNATCRAIRARYNMLQPAERPQCVRHRSTVRLSVRGAACL